MKIIITINSLAKVKNKINFGIKLFLIKKNAKYTTITRLNYTS